VAASYQSLPAVLRETMSATVMYIDALRNLGDDDALQEGPDKEAAPASKRQLSIHARGRVFPDKDYDKAVACIARSCGAVGTDAALLSLKA